MIDILAVCRYNRYIGIERITIRGDRKMRINKGAKVGIIIQMIALAIMVFLVFLNKTISDLLAWIFVLGSIISLVGTLVDLSKKNDKDKNIIKSNLTI